MIQGRWVPQRNPWLQQTGRAISLKLHSNHMDFPSWHIQKHLCLKLQEVLKTPEWEFFPSMTSLLLSEVCRFGSTNLWGKLCWLPHKLFIWSVKSINSFFGVWFYFMWSLPRWILVDYFQLFSWGSLSALSYPTELQSHFQRGCSRIPKSIPSNQIYKVFIALFLIIPQFHFSWK